MSRWERIKSEMDNVSTEGMRILMEEGLPYNKTIKKLIADCEFHYQSELGKFFSSIQETTIFFGGDVAIHCSIFGLSIEIAKCIFHFWAATFHQEEYKNVMKEFVEQEGIPEDLKDVVHILRSQDRIVH